ncbi:TPA: hypothetical protein ACYEOW_001222 [Raoultella terrigena]
MKERGMIFNGEMVRALLDGRKTQTRRPIKWRQTRATEIAEREDGSKWPWSEDAENVCDYWHPCPFGAVGDRIWVRETWARYNVDQDSHDMAYRATAPNDWPKEGRWRPSIHMPRWASRILLEITNVGVQRLQDISSGDAVREGICQLPASGRYCVSPGDQYFGGASHSAKEVYSWLWSSIYGEDSWNANPWVWVIEFKRCDCEH